MDPSSPACKCGDKTPCHRTQDVLDKLLEKQLEKANGDTTHWAYVEGDFKKIPCTHRGNELLHHHKSCGRVIDEHDASPHQQAVQHAPSTVVPIPSLMADFHCVVQFILPLASEGLIPRATSRDTSVPQEIKTTMLQFYKTRNCVILRKLLLKGIDATELHQRKMQACYPAVHAHIIPQAQNGTVRFLGIGVDDPQNALPLFKHIELEWDRGNIALIPMAGTVEGAHLNVLVLVAHSLHNTKMCYADNGKVMDGQHVGNMTFRHIHNVTISFEPEARPYVRCLIFRWETSYRTHPHEFPPPNGDVLSFCRREPEHKEAIMRLLGTPEGTSALPQS